MTASKPLLTALARELERRSVRRSAFPGGFSTGCRALDDLLPGKALQTGGLVEWLAERGEGALTLALLAAAGYEQRVCIGKWRLGHARPGHTPLAHGFTHFYGHDNGAIDYFAHAHNDAPAESRDLASQHPDVVQRLSSLLRDFGTWQSPGVGPYDEGRQGFTPPRDWNLHRRN